MFTYRITDDILMIYNYKQRFLIIFSDCFREFGWRVWVESLGRDSGSRVWVESLGQEFGQVFDSALVQIDTQGKLYRTVCESSL